MTELGVAVAVVLFVVFAIGVYRYDLRRQRVRHAEREAQRSARRADTEQRIRRLRMNVTRAPNERS